MGWLWEAAKGSCSLPPWRRCRDGASRCFSSVQYTRLHNSTCVSTHVHTRPALANEGWQLLVSSSCLFSPDLSESCRAAGLAGQIGRGAIGSCGAVCCGPAALSGGLCVHAMRCRHLSRPVVALGSPAMGLRRRHGPRKGAALPRRPSRNLRRLRRFPRRGAC